MWGVLESISHVGNGIINIRKRGGLKGCDPFGIGFFFGGVDAGVCDPALQAVIPPGSG